VLVGSPVSRTLRFKVRSESYGWLGAAAVEVNQVFNFYSEAALLAALGRVSDIVPLVKESGLVWPMNCVAGAGPKPHCQWKGGRCLQASLRLHKGHCVVP